MDPYFCNVKILGLALERLASVVDQIHVVYFANDPEQCLINSRNFDRQDKKVTGFIKDLSEIYDPPEECIPVFRVQN